MSEVIGPIALESSSGRAIGGKGVDGEYSEHVGAEIDAEVKKIIEEGIRRATETVTAHRNALDTIAERLIEVETIEREEYEQIIVAQGIPLKHKKDIEHSPAV
jgi:cell division protease FtsH